MYIYYTSCNFNAASPATAKKVKAYFEQQMDKKTWRITVAAIACISDGGLSEDGGTRRY